MIQVLIIDDHAIIRRGLIQILIEEFPSAIIEEASDAEQAIKKLTHTQPDVVICDLSMPGRSGLEVVEYVKRNHPNIPTLILSIHPEETYAIRAMQAGAAGYLSKETATRELVDAIHRVLQGRKYISSSLAEKMADYMDFQYDDNKPRHELLSDRELKVFSLLAIGKPISMIAEQLSLSPNTISTYRARILTKLDMKSNAEIARYAVEHKMI